MNSINVINIIRYFAASALIGTLCVGFAVPSLADDGTDMQKATVKFGDLNISTPEGAAALYGRIRAAARSVCGEEQDDLWGRARAESCVHKAIADAVSKVNQPALFIVYNEHYKPPLSTALLSQTR